MKRRVLKMMMMAAAMGLFAISASAEEGANPGGEDGVFTIAYAPHE